MTTLGIIGAMQVEVDLLLKAMDRKYGKTIAGSVFYEGILDGLQVVVVQCGVGKVNAALCAQILCDCFHVTHLVNTGIAGSLQNSSLANSPYMVNLVNDLTDKGESVVIEPKSLAGKTLGITSAQVTRLGVVLGGVLPLGCALKQTLA